MSEKIAVVPTVRTDITQLQYRQMNIYSNVYYILTLIWFVQELSHLLLNGRIAVIMKSRTQKKRYGIIDFASLMKLL